MAQTCTRLDRIEVERPGTVAGSEDRLAIGCRRLHLVSSDA